MINSNQCIKQGTEDRPVIMGLPSRSTPCCSVGFSNRCSGSSWRVETWWNDSVLQRAQFEKVRSISRRKVQWTCYKKIITEECLQLLARILPIEYEPFINFFEKLQLSEVSLDLKMQTSIFSTSEWILIAFMKSLMWINWKLAEARSTNLKSKQWSDSVRGYPEVFSSKILGS